jgi:hypothetical protein
MTQAQTALQLPDYVSLSLTAQNAVTILGALQNSDGPFKTISSALSAVQQQLMSQAVKPPASVAPPPTAPTEPANEEIAHHPV